MGSDTLASGEPGGTPIDAETIVHELVDAEGEDAVGRQSEDFFAVNIPGMLQALAQLETLPPGVNHEDLAVFGLSSWLGRRELRISAKLERLQKDLDRTREKSHRAVKAIGMLEQEVDYLETQLKASSVDKDKIRMEVEKVRLQNAQERDKVDFHDFEAVQKKLDDTEYALSLEKGKVVRMQLNIEALEKELKNFKVDVDFCGELELTKEELRDVHAENERVKITIREYLARNEELEERLRTLNPSQEDQMPGLLPGPPPNPLLAENRKLLEQNNLLAGQLQTYKDQLMSLEVAQEAASQVSRATLVGHEKGSEGLFQKVKDLETSKMELANQVQELTSKLEDASKKPAPVARQDTTTQTMLRQISQLNDQRAQLGDQIDALQDEVDVLSREKAQLAQTAEKLQVQVKTLSEKSSTNDSDAVALREQHLVLEKVITEKDAEIRDLKRKIEDLKQKWGQTQDDLKQCRDDTDRLSKEKQAVLQRQTSAADRQQLQQEASMAKEELRKANEHLNSLESKLKMVESENANLEKSMGAQIDYLRNTNKQLQQKITQLEELVADDESTKDPLTDEIRTAQVRVSEQASKIQHLELQLSEVKRQRSLLNDEKADLEEQIDSLTDQLAKIPLPLAGPPLAGESTTSSPKRASETAPIVPRGLKAGEAYLKAITATASQVMAQVSQRSGDDMIDGWTAWHVAVWSKRADLFDQLPVEKLLQRTHALGWTPLHLAVALNDPDTFAALTTTLHRKDESSLWSPLSQLVETRDHGGQTVFHLALTLKPALSAQQVTFPLLLKELSKIPLTADPLQVVARARSVVVSILDLDAAQLVESTVVTTLHTLVSIIAPFVHRLSLFPPLQQRLNRLKGDLATSVPGNLWKSISIAQAARFVPTAQLNSDDTDLAEELKAASKSIRRAISDEGDDVKFSCPGDQLKLARRPVLHQILKEYPEPELAAKAMYSGLCYQFSFGKEVTRNLSLCVVVAGQVMLWEFVQVAPDGQISRLESSRAVPADATLKLRKEDCREFKLADMQSMTMFANVECFVLFDVVSVGQILIETPDRLMLHKHLVNNYKLATSLRVYRPELKKGGAWGMTGERLNLTVTELPVALPIKDQLGGVRGSLLTLRFPSKAREADCVAIPNAAGTCLSHIATQAAVYRAATIRVKLNPILSEVSETIQLSPDVQEVFCLLLTSGELRLFHGPTEVEELAVIVLDPSSGFRGIDRRLPSPPGGQANKVFGAFKEFLNRALSGTLSEPGMFAIHIAAERRQLVLFFDDAEQRDDWLRALYFAALAQPLTL